MTALMCKRLVRLTAVPARHRLFAAASDSGVPSYRTGGSSSAAVLGWPAGLAVPLLDEPVAPWVFLVTHAGSGDRTAAILSPACCLQQAKPSMAGLAASPLIEVRPFGDG